mmetsp:Transcript_10687/g.23645  ORF Transcript_10687/g.23645 Transcript_10687/m.23645 type:complete len:173 (-) Transcript_10687:109-627(-)|eukprot:CAMPEP_0172300938 /NCGR_PEP_ID=MMETSP1058-20130122/2927_1 /TAXON_ID=83371 /ORGANISM="Detonula confervacea, Strain CCMP 353" /LENGTH=172 /DNA_ID=CAMNT_0013010889 /DNA_START=27 /DNA_END=545 /DNA_ORIENTATION=-
MFKGPSVCISFVGACILLGLLKSSVAFAPSPSSPTRPHLPLLATKDPLQLTSNLSPSQIANLATVPSHSETKSGTWSESISADKTFTRFIVEGEGSITLTGANGETTRKRISPGSLVEVKGAGGESQLVWDVDSELVVLYSGDWFNDQQKVAIGLLGLLAVACGLANLGVGQ